tara:strand:+ start:20015 stop:20740 length:726 start_codon:yes stop_codon:yes gene_type:complete
MKKLNVCALSTARAGSKSVLDKNILDANGSPLFSHPIRKANQSRYISAVFCSTNHSQILDQGKRYNYTPIKRPQELCRDNSSHHEAIKHGVIEIEKVMGRLDIIVVLLGNTLGAEAVDLDSAIESLGKNDSVVSVNEMNMFNPSRSWVVRDGLCSTLFSPEAQSLSSGKGLPNDKNYLGNIYFFNGNFWIIKRECVFQKGNNPFPWLGKSIKPYIQKEVFMEIDAPWQKDYLLSQLSKPIK